MCLLIQLLSRIVEQDLKQRVWIAIYIQERLPWKNLFFISFDFLLLCYSLKVNLQYS
jgi:hypothetical protein